MKKGALNFLGRKNQSLFDTNVKIKDMDAMELVLDSPAIPESGTASVRARPTVKHHAASDSFQGFAVPTPKVPLLPPVSAPKVNGSVGASWSNGSVMSVPDLVEGEIMIPPPPSMAPPPPPETFIPPPPGFMGDLNPDTGLGTLQPSSIPAPKPTSLAPSKEADLASLKPATTAAEKPPSTSSISTAPYAHISYPPAAEVPEHPNFAAPQPPVERPKKTQKAPPPKPIRMSSIPTLDLPPHTPAPPPPVQTSAVSSFNPQNKAKLYDAPKASFFTGYEDRDTKPKQMLLLEDSGSVNTPPVLVRVDGKVPKVATTSIPVSKDVQKQKENLENIQPSQPPLPKLSQEATTATVSAQQEITKPLQTPPQTSTQIQERNSTQLNVEPNKDRFQESSSQSRNFSPLLDRKLRNLKGSETNGAREGHATSPLALLMAAKEREKQKLTHALSQENSAKKNEQQSASIHPSDSSPNSFVVIPKSSLAYPLTSQEQIQDNSKSVSPVEQTQPIQTSKISSSSPQIGSQVPSTTPAVSQTTAAGSTIVTNPLEQKQNKEHSSSKPQLAPPKVNSEGLSLPFLPPPPEFDDFDDVMEPPPSIRPPDPPVKKATPAVNIASPAPTASAPPASIPTPYVTLPPPAPPLSLSPPAPSPTLSASVPPPSSIPSPPMTLPPPAPPLSLPPPAPVPTPFVIVPRPASVSTPPVPPPAPPLSLSSSVNPPPPPPPPLPSPKPKPTASPKLPAPDSDVKLKHNVQRNTQVPAPSQVPSTLSPSQATLLSILQKKMLEMDHKMAPVKEPESSGDDWNGPLSDEEIKVPTVLKATPQSNNSPVANKAATLDMRELKSKVVKQKQPTSSVKVPTSNGPSKHPYGMTFTVRPGTKQPITPVSKGESY